ncbi:MAG: hypothetical protein IPL32_15690 [Chloracidobacterium sp.]|nr:hypothetical protein [Chloracidobacterium sp.]
MKKLFLIVLCLGVLAIPCLAASWNNIFPLKTTRAEVIKLLGEPKPFQRTGPEYFDHGNARVFIRWTLPNCIVKKLVIAEELAGPDALVYQIAIEPKDYRTSLPYEKEVSEFLGLIKAKDCIASRGGSCGIGHALLGFGYNRSEFGISRLDYSSSLEEMNAWISQRKLCNPR